MKSILRAIGGFACLLCLSGALHAADMAMEFIALKHRPAEELIPIIQPFLRPDASITGTQYKLFIRTTPDNFAELRDMISSLDAPLRRLLVTVTQNTDIVLRERDLAVSGRVQLGAGTRIITTDRGDGRGMSVEHRDGREVLRGRVNSTASREDSADLQQIQVLEGQPAMIQIGQSVPMLERSVNHGYYGSEVHDSLQYRDVTRGFAVLARTHGEQVTLEISPHRNSLSSRDGGSIDTQSMHTTLSGRLGEWLEVGGVATSVENNDSGIIYRTQTRATDQHRVFIKVEPLP